RFAIEYVGVRSGQDKTVARQVNGRGNQRGARPAAVFRRRALEPHYGAGYPGRPVPVPAEVGDRPAAAVEVHIGPRGGGGGSPEVTKGLAAVGRRDRHEPAAADIAAARVDNRERIPDGDRGIDRVAALGKDAYADL